jgi:hypothetical protein
MPPDSVETRLAILETKMDAMEDFRDDVKALRADIHTIKETIAASRGGWRAVITLIGLLASVSAVAGAVGAFIHKAATSPFVAP